MRLDKSPKLYKIKGRRSPIVTQMPTVAWSEINEGDVFIIDLYDVIFIWQGSEANKMEKITAANVKMCLK